MGEAAGRIAASGEGSVVQAEFFPVRFPFPLGKRLGVRFIAFPVDNSDN
jgi:hypothetical protein